MPGRILWGMPRPGSDSDASGTPVYDRMIAEFGDPYIPPIPLTIPPFYPEESGYRSSAVPEQTGGFEQNGYQGQRSGYGERPRYGDNGYGEPSQRGYADQPTRVAIPGPVNGSHHGAHGGQQWGPMPRA